MADGLEIILGDAQVKSVFVNVFGGITSCIEVARGIVAALEILVGRRDQADRRPARRQQRRRGAPQILAAAHHPLVTVGRHHGRAAAQAAELAAA